MLVVQHDNGLHESHRVIFFTVFSFFPSQSFSWLGYGIPSFNNKQRQPANNNTSGFELGISRPAAVRGQRLVLLGNPFVRHEFWWDAVGAWDGDFIRKSYCTLRILVGQGRRFGTRILIGSQLYSTSC